MVGVSASVNLPLHYKVQKFSSGTGSPGWSLRKGRKTVVCVYIYIDYSLLKPNYLQEYCYQSLEVTFVYVICRSCHVIRLRNKNCAIKLQV